MQEVRGSIPRSSTNFLLSTFLINVCSSIKLPGRRLRPVSLGRIPIGALRFQSSFNLEASLRFLQISFASVSVLHAVVHVPQEIDLWG